MKRLIVLVAALGFTTSACDQLGARLIHASIHKATDVRHTVAVDGPSVVSPTGWAQPADGRGFGTWLHDPAVADGCSEWDVEPAAELDNAGALCKSVVP